ncbi:PstS family phosphate ABC transporter substrate-binding protein [Hymenobacter baengnokdamensis]|uniref:PstS family phosphate ABC transporter substrate-binding protein n=1 Tax=Hymenobacter baengnokdamensis TaxID=2615203 RepID=UPI00177E3E7A|nr:substrate-binding domain-containing protein [Hymenobacter baengnokdamensis]
MILAKPTWRPGRAILGALLLTSCLLPACHPDRSAGTSEDATDTPTSGHVGISVDETFAPVMESQVDTFQKLYVDAHLKVTYQPEDSVFLDLLNDKVKAIVVSRELNADEKKELDKQNMLPRATKVGIDGLAIILHPSNPDTLLTVAQLRSIFSGQTAQWSEVSGQKKLGGINVVFDANRSSTSRFVRDTLLRGGALSPKAAATQSNRKLIEYVATHPSAIGIVGVNWISDFDDPNVRGFLRRIRVASITARPHPTKDDYIQPYQVYLAPKPAALLKEHPELQNYPLRRDIYAISREARAGLGSGFVSFVAGQKGQLIFQKSGLMPANMQARIVTTNKRQ